MENKYHPKLIGKPCLLAWDSVLVLLENPKIAFKFTSLHDIHKALQKGRLRYMPEVKKIIIYNE